MSRNFRGKCSPVLLPRSLAFSLFPLLLLLFALSTYSREGKPAREQREIGSHSASNMRVPTLTVYIISLSHGHRDDEEELCLRCRWVGGDTCASSSDASALYIRDGANVVQWKGSSLPSLYNTLLTSASSEKCLGWIRSGDSVRFFFLPLHPLPLHL